MPARIYWVRPADSAMCLGRWTRAKKGIYLPFYSGAVLSGYLSCADYPNYPKIAVSNKRTATGLNVRAPLTAHQTYGKHLPFVHVAERARGALCVSANCLVTHSLQNIAFGGQNCGCHTALLLRNGEAQRHSRLKAHPGGAKLRKLQRSKYATFAAGAYRQ